MAHLRWIHVIVVLKGSCTINPWILNLENTWTLSHYDWLFPSYQLPFTFSRVKTLWISQRKKSVIPILTWTCNYHIFVKEKKKFVFLRWNMYGKSILQISICTSAGLLNHTLDKKTNKTQQSVKQRLVILFLMVNAFYSYNNKL